MNREQIKYGEDEIDLKELFSNIKNNIFTIFIITVLFITIALGYTYWGKTIYSSSNIISLGSDKQSGLGIGAMLNRAGLGTLGIGLGSGSGGEIESASVILKSKKFLKDIIDRVEIDREYFIQKNFRKVEVENFPNFKIDIKYKDKSLYENYFKIIPLDKKQYILEVNKIKYKNIHKYGEEIDNQYFTMIVDRKNGINPYKIIEKRDNNISNYIYSLNLEKKSYIFRDLNVDTQIDILIANMSITDKKLNMIEIKYQGTLPKKIEKIVSTLTKSFIERKLKEKNSKLDHNLEIVNRQIRDIDMDLKKKVKKIEKFAEKNNLLVSDNGGNIVNDIYTRKQRIESLSLQIQEVENFINNLNEDILSSVILVSVGIDITSIQKLMDNFISTDNAIRELELQEQNIDKSITSNSQIASFIDRLKSKRNQLETFLTDFTEEHPQVIKQEEEIRKLVDKININISTNLEKLKKNKSIIKSTILTNISMVKKNLNKKLEFLENDMRKKKTLLHSLPANKTLSRNLNKTFSFNEKIYTILLQKRVEFEIEKVSLTASIKILEDSYIAKKPDKPKKVLILIVSAITGIIFGIFFVFLREFLNDRIKNIKDIKSLTETTLLGTLSNIKNKKEFQKNIIDIRTNLQLLTLNKSCTKVLISSTEEKDNKEVLSTGLAKTLSDIGKKVLIVDLNLRKSKLHKTFKYPNKVGIANYLPENIELSTTISTITKNLDFIPAGSGVVDVPALLMSSKLKYLVDNLEKEYNYIIFNMASIEFESDIKIISKYSDIIILDVIKGLSKKESIINFNKIKEDSNFKLSGIVFYCR
jgi:capsular exopolysaccharide synthesis family protein